MTPAEIAKKLTPAQVSALRDPRNCSLYAFRMLRGLAIGQDQADRHLVTSAGFRTDLGRAVLAELDKGETHGQG